MKKYNVVWCIVDSVRKYHSDDDRTRLDFMDEFSTEAVEFKNVVTSAPSTVMSISAMMTSLPSYYLGKNYSDFRFDNNYFTTLSTILKSQGWVSRALIMHKDIREKLRVFDLVPRKYWPKGFSHKDWWDNSKINQLLKNTIRIDGDSQVHPCFWVLDFNCREDPETSNIVKDSFKALSDAGYTKDNTIYILCSDHGYPDPRRGITPEQLARENMTHDIFMTDDNITIPFIISYPGCEKGRNIETTISTLDVMPTLLDIMGVSPDPEVSSRWKGKSFLPLLEGSSGEEFKDPKIRTDARFFGQSGRVSAIRGDRYKYVFHHDHQVEEFIDVSEFNLDEVDISNSTDKMVQDKLSEFREHFKGSEIEGIEFQIAYTIYQLKNKIGASSRVAPSFLVISDVSPSLLGAVSQAIRSSANDAVVDLIAFTVSAELPNGFNQQIINDHSKMQGHVSIGHFEEQRDYDFCLVTYDSSDVNSQNVKLLTKISKTLNIKNVELVDLNMTVAVEQGQILRYLRTLYENRDFYKQEPLLIFGEITKMFKASIQRLNKKLGF